ARAADDDDLAAVAGQGHGDRHGVRYARGVGHDLGAARAEEFRQLLARVAGGGVDDVVGAGGGRRPAAHGHGVDADDRVGAGRDQRAQRELADDAEAEHGGGAAERDAGADGRTHAVAGDAGPGRL